MGPVYWEGGGHKIHLVAGVGVAGDVMVVVRIAAGGVGPVGMENGAVAVVRVVATVEGTGLLIRTVIVGLVAVVCLAVAVGNIVVVALTGAGLFACLLEENVVAGVAIFEVDEVEWSVVVNFGTFAGIPVAETAGQNLVSPVG